MYPILKSFSLIMLFYFAGELFTNLLDLPIPGNVVGMVLLFTALQAKWVESKSISIAALPLVGLLNLFFVPAGVGLLAYEQLLAQNLYVIIVSSAISSLLVMWVVAKLFTALKKT